MKNLFILSLFWFVSQQMALSQISLSGKVVDKNGYELTGASVAVNPGNIGTVSDMQGAFNLELPKKGTYSLTVSFIGFETLEKQITVSGSEVINLMLQEKSIMANEVIVTSIRAGAKTPVAKTDITSEELEKLNTADDIPLLLSLTPSVVSSTEAGIGIGYSSMRIRGTDATRINVTVNGIPINDAESQGVFWVNMPDFSSSVDNLQIQRGVGTSTNGSAAFGASVNLNTASHSTSPFTEISSTVGSFNTYKNSVKVGTGLLNDKFTFEARYSDLKTDGYVDYAFSDHKSLYISGSMILENSLIKANIIHGDQKTGISWWGIDEETLKTDRTYNPAGEYVDVFGDTQYYKDQTDNYKQTHYQLFYTQTIPKGWLLNTALHYTRGEGFYEQYKMNEDFSAYGWVPYIIGDQTISTTDLIRQKWLTNDFYGFTSSLNYSSDLFDLNIGGGWNKYDGDHFGNVIWARNAYPIEKGDKWYDNNGLKTDYNIYGKINFRANQLISLFADIQYRGINYKIKGIDDDLSADPSVFILDQEHQYNFINPKVGAYINVNEANQFYASYAIANREPTRADFKNANGDMTATPKSERLNDLEIGFQHNAANIVFSANFYHMFYKDQLIPTGEKSNVGYTIMTNVDKSYRTGIELAVKANLLPNLSWTGNATFSKNIIRDFVETATTHNDIWNSEKGEYSDQRDTIIYHGNSTISYSPSITANSIIEYKPINSASIRLITKHVGEQYFDNTQSSMRKLDAYTVWDGIISKSFSPGWAKIELQLAVNNIFDLKYNSNAYVWEGTFFNYVTDVEYSYNYYYPQAGRHLFFKTTIRF